MLFHDRRTFETNECHGRGPDNVDYEENGNHEEKGEETSFKKAHKEVLVLLFAGSRDVHRTSRF
jgi:hypothetical protein